MRQPTASIQLLTLAWIGILAGGLLGCLDDSHGQKTALGPSTVVLRLADSASLRRPAVPFDHGRHTTALGQESCETCHQRDGSGKVSFGPIVRDSLVGDEGMNAYHDACTRCHEDRSKEGKSAGPVTCGGCHALRGGGSISTRAEIRFDYALHHRHEAAEHGACKRCHHVYDEKSQKLVYEKGKESACRTCHGAKDEGKKPSLRRASHAACVSCHEGHAAKGEKAGPTRCEGCHDAQRLATTGPMNNVPRLERGQPNWTWLRADGATTALVAFNHEGHEKVTRSCSSCHHESLRACKDCHTLDGKSEGGFVTLEQAYHRPSSTHSCVGCHREQTQQTNCAGCHHAPPEGDGESSCKRCHTGPPGNTVADALPPPNHPPAQLEELPPASDDFPEQISLEHMPGGTYGPASFPHRRIVQRLDQAVRHSRLATQLHGRLETLCAGCHHHTPLGSRPPKCSTCHAAKGAPTQDRPGLRAAYHRQCVTCHQQMEIKAGCTDCHAEASKEGKQ